MFDPQDYVQGSPILCLNPETGQICRFVPLFPKPKPTLEELQQKVIELQGQLSALEAQKLEGRLTFEEWNAFWETKQCTNLSTLSSLISKMEIFTKEREDSSW